MWLFRPQIGPHKTCGFKLNVQRARASAIVSPSMNLPCARARIWGLCVFCLALARNPCVLPSSCPRATLCFTVLWHASRVRARLDYLHRIGSLRVRSRATGSFCVTASPTCFIRTFCVSLVGMIFIAPFLALSNTVSSTR